MPNAVSEGIILESNYIRAQVPFRTVLCSKFNLKSDLKGAAAY